MKSKSKKSIHVLIACGGTGGHLFPGIAVGEVLSARGHEVTLLISEKKIDSIAASGHKDLHFEKMPFLAMPKPWSPKMIGFLAGLWKGMAQCRKIIRDKDVSVVLGMGGFTSFAPLYAGKKEKCHTLIHESNAIPGKANKLNARYASTVLCGLEACKEFFPQHTDVRVVGTPVRSAMRTASKEDPYEFFKLDKTKKTLLIMGGSQGARGVNRVVGMTLEQFEKMGIQVLHIAGPTDYEEVRDVYAKNPLLPQHVAAFCHRMDLAYRVADLAIARSGASSMSELAYFGVPSLLIPYPSAADDHQTRNAEVFSKEGAARLLTEKELNADVLADAVRDILMNPKKADEMKRAANKMAVRNAAEKIAELIVKEG
ncbi:UDP-N-acetylglucosamine-N-acetylmuramylpentapeptide N-acetylglucosamine transferase [Prosthecobacter fusiformis]|uniref:UDP-N-acetylglucosamine--N-acetylmuramyl-(pentapeptide) pyrophosphoryl-undecaprenol N-acetylglucosamine transferase n=1 Tax=Prosthecobacter fusiformis TaxID=48464 RepID=A0A4R7RJC3_9BACT|nr:undecaprenyldiphospho-muramoylpentapeptide beta-N-acetylglucosaminyltransferase [Prosthecobacter fusiformis]TDU64247.1 UDP-N-acetylglucosamine-N-acetylmuramylpentapeptide N-acetylglucosamine transferase [Prosthecobacter fusiformis]